MSIVATETSHPMDEAEKKRIVKRLKNADKKGLSHFPLDELIPSMNRLLIQIEFLEKEIESRKQEKGELLGAREGVSFAVCSTCAGDTIVMSWNRENLNYTCTKCGPRFTLIDPLHTTDEIEIRESVDHPDHYNVGGIEVIDAIEAWKLGWHDGSAMKYVARAQYKGDYIGDLKKARWCLDREIQRFDNSPEHLRDCINVAEQHCIVHECSADQPCGLGKPDCPHCEKKVEEVEDE